MNHPTNSNVIIGSKLALAIAKVVGSPVRVPFVNIPEPKRVVAVKMARRCESLHNRSRKLLGEMKALDIQIAIDSARMKSAAGREKTKRIGTVIDRMMEQQIALHSKTENLLDEMMRQIRGGMETHS